MSERKKGVYASDSMIYITDYAEENTVTIYKSNENKILVTTEYDFGIDGLSIILDKTEVKQLINLLINTLESKS